ncbi:polysaccharide biosynthesis protein [Marinobacter sp. CHS3-4]|uniref:polysaccharide biosynthesis protein n=1 Tax=Marinobacter sp. CHS3-4 TaxID=3045174 RepID=UPI0024B5DD0E|nr:polysaccharide biosynthesis protein [Marinobacter sp. CHS3-4]MDI9244994.1 polysaccharide biosynthesis protein [Marinobacter sp. CHS3-4]
MRSLFSDKTVLITGGTGSFGHEVLNRLLLEPVKEVRIFSRDELKQSEMRSKIKDSRVKFWLGDVRNRPVVDQVMSGVDLVFHAAALKQVPSCEFFPMEAVLTNVDGSNNVIESAISKSVEKVICLSTDKAVYPLNTMGMTKALMEKVARATAKRCYNDSTTICCVRYGNVMYSRGSVIPLFIEQIKKGGPITITDPEMTRFLLPLSDAIGLVLFAFENGSQGDIFIKKAPAATVGDIAEVLQDIMGIEVPVKVLGMRHGEKLHETLATREEILDSVDMGDYLRCLMDDRGLDYDKYISEGEPSESQLEDYTSESTDRLNKKELKKLLLSLPQIIDLKP